MINTNKTTHKKRRKSVKNYVVNSDIVLSSQIMFKNSTDRDRTLEFLQSIIEKYKIK